MQCLSSLGIDDNTVVFFTSDNGGLASVQERSTSNLPLRAGKGFLYEGGIRVPTIIRWPGVARAGSTSDVPVICTDFHPTMLEMSGLPLMAEQHADGKSLVALLKGKGVPDRKALYWHYPHYGFPGHVPSGAIRMGDYKLIESFEDFHVELYNLRKDIGEKKDLSKDMPKKTREMKNMLHAWRKKVGAKMPVANPKFKKKA